MGTRIKDREFWESARSNSVSFQHYYRRLLELCLSRFDWKNVPETIDTRWLELMLYGVGYCLFFKDDTIGYLCLQADITGDRNVYNIPIMRRARANNGYHADRTIEDSVIIYNNMIHTGNMLDIEDFAYRLWDIDQIISVNVRAQKTPVLISCEENQLLTMKNVYKKYDGNEPVIFGDKNITPNSVRVLSTGAPYVADRLYMLKENIWCEALTFLGINNISVNKKERLISSEVEARGAGTESSRYSQLETRKQACRQINAMFGLNMDVEFRDDNAIYDNGNPLYDNDPLIQPRVGDSLEGSE